jgi:O-antigen ligase
LIGGFLPNVFLERLSTVSDTISNGVPADTSIAGRFLRWQWALDAMRNYPLMGIGYGHWQIHNSFLEIGSKIGIIPAFIFIAFLIQLFIRIGKTWLSGQTQEVRRYGLIFTGLAISWMAQFLTGTVFYNPLYSVAHWLMMALGWYLLALFTVEPEAIDTANYRNITRKSNMELICDPQLRH